MSTATALQTLAEIACLAVPFTLACLAENILKERQRR